MMTMIDDMCEQIEKDDDVTLSNNQQNSANVSQGSATVCGDVSTVHQVNCSSFQMFIVFQCLLTIAVFNNQSVYYANMQHIKIQNKRQKLIIFYKTFKSWAKQNYYIKNMYTKLYKQSWAIKE